MEVQETTVIFAGLGDKNPAIADTAGALKLANVSADDIIGLFTGFFAFAGAETRPLVFVLAFALTRDFAAVLVGPRFAFEPVEALDLVFRELARRFDPTAMSYPPIIYIDIHSMLRPAPVCCKALFDESPGHTWVFDTSQ